MLMEYVNKQTQIDREIEAAKEINKRLQKKKELAEIERENRRLRKEIMTIESDDGSGYGYSGNGNGYDSGYNSPYTNFTYCNTNGK